MDDKQVITDFDLLLHYEGKEIRPGVYTHTFTPSVICPGGSSKLRNRGRDEFKRHTFYHCDVCQADITVTDHVYDWFFRENKGRHTHNYYIKQQEKKETHNEHGI